jgi:hypothetical protein
MKVIGIGRFSDVYKVWFLIRMASKTAFILYYK